VWGGKVQRIPPQVLRIPAIPAGTTVEWEPAEPDGPNAALKAV